MTRALRRQLVVAVGAFLALVVGIVATRPVFVGKAPVVQELIGAAGVEAPLAPWIEGNPAEAIQTSQFFADRHAFADDLLRTGKVTVERAWRLADVAVREAYKRRVPPALVLGVMLTENDELKSTARSKVGAIGLMQIHPRPWRNLRKIFGSNLRSDSTNLKYGIFILGHLATEANKRTGRDDSWRSALLRYNGCVRGTNTKNCKRYPDVVRREVQRSARFSCGDKDFVACVVEPMWLAKKGD
jgi:soluble lytic murein transglycosylase-like protein